MVARHSGALPIVPRPLLMGGGRPPSVDSGCTLSDLVHSVSVSCVLLVAIRRLCDVHEPYMIAMLAHYVKSVSTKPSADNPIQHVHDHLAVSGLTVRLPV